METKKILFITSAIFCMLLSCGSNKSMEPKDEPIVTNEKIQSSFFGANFGDCQDTVLKKFRQNGLMLKRNSSTNSFYHFEPINGQYYSFGNMNWKMIYVSFTNNKFESIRFLNAYTDKSQAIKSTESIANVVSKKYNIGDWNPNDSTVYVFKYGVDKGNENRITVTCYRYESISNNLFYGTELSYRTYKFVNEGMDDL